MRPDPAADRWEHGSEFHWIEPDEIGGASGHNPWDAGACWLGSGRAALVEVLRRGVDELGWTRLWLPDYFCQDVVAAMVQVPGLELATYAYSPRDGAISLERSSLTASDAVLLSNTLGLAPRPVLASRHRVYGLVEDHTHDPWSSWANSSEADFAIASLRKTLPIPDGAVAWSPNGHALPQVEPVRRHEQASGLKLQAMLLKRWWLEGRWNDKDAFRRTAIAGEQQVGEDTSAAMSAISRALVQSFPAAEWRRRRMDNYSHLASRLQRMGIDVIPPRADACPFAVTLSFDSHDERERHRKALIEARVYPAVLWSLDEPALPSIGEAALETSRRLLCLHCDGRYDRADLDRVAARLESLGDPAS